MLLIGFLFGISGVKPIPVILVVQALNGFVLPLLAYFLILLVNDSNVIPQAERHAIWYDGILVCIFGTTLFDLFWNAASSELFRNGKSAFYSRNIVCFLSYEFA